MTDFVFVAKTLSLPELLILSTAAGLNEVSLLDFVTFSDCAVTI